MLNNVKLMLNIDVADTSKDELLNLLIEQCSQYALEYTHRDDVSPLKFIVCEMVVERYNKLKSEGLESISFDGVSESFNQNYSTYIMQMLRPKRKLRTI